MEVSPQTSSEAPEQDELLCIEPARLETQPFERHRGLIPGRLRILSKGSASQFLKWTPTIDTNMEYQVEFDLCRLSSLSRSNGPRVSFVFNEHESVGPFLLDSQADYDRLIHKLADLRILEPNTLEKPQTSSLGDFFSTVADFYNAFRQLGQPTTSDRVPNRVTFLPPDEEKHRGRRRDRAGQTTSPPRADVVCRGTEDMGEMGKAEVIYLASSLPPREVCQREEPVSLKEWESFFQNGNLVREVALRRRVFKGGLAPDARACGWKFFLHFHDDEESVREATQRYHTMRMQWHSMYEEQLEHNKHLKEQQSLIAKDVCRTDRVHPLFADEKGPGLQALTNILTTYVMYNWDLGYVQGMSDVAAMLYAVLQDEVSTFWCFVDWMDRRAVNFDQTQSGIVHQLGLLANLLKYIDPELMAHFDEHGSNHLFFCFRWLIVLFKREFKYTDAMAIWEAVWTEYLSEDFAVFICAAIILSVRDRILAENMAYDDILKTFNDMAMHMDAATVLSDAESIFRQLHACDDDVGLPPKLLPLRHMWTERYGGDDDDGDDEDDDDDDGDDDDHADDMGGGHRHERGTAVVHGDAATVEEGQRRTVQQKQHQPLQRDAKGEHELAQHQEREREQEQEQDEQRHQEQEQQQQPLQEQHQQQQQERERSP
ncbi:hypothetical protein PTSG_02552 [Salpingoeca rosetta]|uniref:Rab-GAP TBC domain-containing protein n=1 Tax=Salpingoeca rosetta (strain ATCC 50818 / BSB-021) TaxID=946362 RepID=F2U2I5_SALR5|nr:uncharacterized protein PTSG_02552 [Salpingoeca rosetta]EGD81837.1 hypothetical protein PTSG_02552 [Salpingoeca rosetta]|eukprot:XP_004997041.1 hypothetical protein PTSG_02552 [Salpingoeca rosetta]